MKNNALQNPDLVRKITLLVGILSFVMLLPACRRAEPSPQAPLPASPTWTPRESIPTQTIGLAISPAPSLAPPTPSLAPPTPTATSGDGISTDWVSIAMFDERNGWGQTDRGLLITTDGGAHWEDVTPDGILDRIFRIHILDASTSLVFAKYDDYHTILYRTMDGGRTWESLIMPLIQGSYSFVDTQNGWILSFLCGTGHCDGILWRTTDAGETWEPIHSFGPDTDESPNTIPYVGIKDGITFSDLNHGWLRLDWAPEITVFDTLYLTEDGGVSWQPQELPLPPGADKRSVDKGLPRFFTDQEGILPVVFHGDPPVLVLYTTRDGGATWNETTGFDKSEYGIVYECVSLQECWVVYGEKLMVSHDGAQTWAQIFPNINMEGVWKLEFVNSRTGWALRREQSGKEQLYRTDDGGLTWNPLFP